MERDKSTDKVESADGAGLVFVISSITKCASVGFGNLVTRIAVINVRSNYSCCSIPTRSY